MIDETLFAISSKPCQLLTMKLPAFILLFFFLFATAAAQFPPIGTIDFYGLRTVSERQIREVLPIKEGDAVFKSKEEAAEIEKRLASLPNVVEAKLNIGCCTGDGKSTLYIGIREKGADVLRFRAAPVGKVRLTDEILKLGEEFSDALQKAVLKGDVAEDHSAGHSLVNNAEVRAIQEKFIPVADRNLKLLRQVLRESSDAQHRSLAAQIIAYYKDKSAIVADLVEAIKDADSIVRNNAMRALGVIAGYAQAHPEKKIKVPFEPFVAMLNSLEWTDRNKSALVLGELTASRDAELLKLLREKAVPSLVEMARWKNDGHAGTSFFILGRLGGLSDDEVGQLWIGGKREDLIAKVQQNLRKR